ncbi:hypothetical protein N0B51_02940 [Tsuneonella sp. YG55]|uniref:Uncharacterized protein n=1 Tax=Tsuneonella litorea TaxID=2976475 RepID=A0A9X2VZ39_9SPHN|nr:hypothetical protein [Tsuneonella litorea]MCT2557933.1 hypothetical protein [Tsuneonella litorea]
MKRLVTCALVTGAVVAGAFGGGTAAARDPQPTATPAVIEGIYSCREIAEADRRLACFDAASAALAAAEAARDIAFADREAVRETRKGLFGFTLPKLGIFGGDDDESEEFQTLTSTIARAGEYAPGKWYFVLPDGARWQQTDSQVLYRDPTRGEEIVIRKAAMGSYMANIAGRRGIRVKRVD